MALTSANKTRAKSKHSPSKFQHMKSISSSQAASTGRVEEGKNPDNHDKEYDSPPNSLAEAFSPSRSRTKGLLGAGNLGRSPSSNRILGGDPSPGLGARLHNVPAPISTQAASAGSKQAQIQTMCEPLPARQLPSINELLRNGCKLTEGSEATYDSSSELRQTQNPSMLIPRPRHVPGQRINTNSQDRLGTNPYALRADEIGPHNGVPGLGSLENLLTPPGWQPGDEPIDEDEAKRLYNLARDRAKKTLDASSEELGILSAERQGERYAEKSAEWDRQRKLDNVLLQERIKIHQAYQVYKQNLAQRAIGQQQGPFQPQMYHGSQAMMQPPVQRYQQSQVPGSPQLERSSPTLSGGHLYQRLQQIQQGLHFPQLSPISPTFLDPTLIPTTYQAVQAYYHTNKKLLFRLQEENEHYLHVWGAKFGETLEGTVSPGHLPSPITGYAAGPFHSVHQGYAPRSQGYAPMNHGNWSTARIPFSQAPGSFINSGQFAGRGSLLPAAPRPPVGRSNLRQEFFRRPDLTKKQQTYDQQRGDQKVPPERQSEKPLAKAKRGSKPKSDKTEKLKFRYQDEIANANLPTSVISQEALKAGMNTIPPRAQTPAASQSRSRRRMPIIDPSVGFVVSAQGAQALIAHGAIDRTKRNQAAATTKNDPVESQTTMGRVEAAAEEQISTSKVSGTERTTEAGESVKAAAASPKHHAADGQAGTCQSDGPDSQSQHNSGTHNGLSISSDVDHISTEEDPDDPNDTTFGKRKAAGSRKAVTSRKVATVSKRRKSDLPEQAKKRTRFSRDGTTDGAE